jgi:hypothetical protein
MAAARVSPNPAVGTFCGGKKLPKPNPPMKSSDTPLCSSRLKRERKAA